MHKNKQAGFSAILVLIPVVLAIGAYFYLKTNKETSPTMLIESSNNEATEATIELTTEKLIEYRSEKYGFKIEYPESLGVTEVEDYDIQAEHREYNKQCKSGERQGCGGSRWPDYEIRFLNSESKSIFTVAIYAELLAEFLGGKENAGFTYSVDDESIQDSMSFFPAENPLQCLWTDEFELKDVTGLTENAYDQVSGYFFNQTSRECEATSIFSYREKDRSPYIPFKSLSECTKTCAGL